MTTHKLNGYQAGCVIGQGILSELLHQPVEVTYRGRTYAGLLSRLESDCLELSEVTMSYWGRGASASPEGGEMRKKDLEGEQLFAFADPDFSFIEPAEVTE